MNDDNLECLPDCDHEDCAQSIRAHQERRRNPGPPTVPQNTTLMAVFLICMILICMTGCTTTCNWDVKRSDDIDFEYPVR